MRAFTRCVCSNSFTRSMGATTVLANMPENPTISQHYYFSCSTHSLTYSLTPILTPILTQPLTTTHSLAHNHSLNHSPPAMKSFINNAMVSFMPAIFDRVRQRSSRSRVDYRQHTLTRSLTHSLHYFTTSLSCHTSLRFASAITIVGNYSEDSVDSDRVSE